MSAPGVRVFYANLLYGEYDRNEWEMEMVFPTLPVEIYQGGYVHINQVRYGTGVGWYRMDGTPVLDRDVPKELRLLLLLLT